MTFALAACGENAASGSAASGASASGSNPVLKVGVFEPASGDNGAGGKQEVLGIQYANQVTPTVDINGQTYDIQLEIVDNQSTTDKAITAAQSLVNAGVSVVLGSYGSGVCIAAAPTFQQAQIPAIGCSCTNPAVTEQNPYYFRVCFLDPFQGSVMARTFQNIRLWKSQTVFDNILIAKHLRRTSGLFSATFRLNRREEAAQRADVERLLEIVGLSEAKDELATSLPYGKQRRLEIARALATEPKLLLLDEPAAGMPFLQTSPLRKGRLCGLLAAGERRKATHGGLRPSPCRPRCGGWGTMHFWAAPRCGNCGLRSRWTAGVAACL